MADTEFTPAQARELLMTLVGATEDSTVKEVLKAAVLAKAASDGLKAQGLTPEQVVRDLFIQGELHKVPPAFEIKMGPAVAASGEGATGMVDHYSKFAPQPQALTAEYNRFSDEMGQLRAYLKAVTEQVEGLAKAFATFVAAKADEEKEDEEEEQEINVAVEANEDDEEDDDAEKSMSKAAKALSSELKADLLAKADEEDEEDEQEINMGDEEEEDEEDEAEKSLSAKSKASLSLASFVAAKAAMKEAVGKGRNRVKKASENALRKAHKMAKDAEERAEEEKDKEAKKTAKKALEAISEYMCARGIPLVLKAKKRATKVSDEGQQTEWPNKESMKSFEGMVANMEKMQTDVRGFMDRIAGMSKGSQPATEIVEPLAKAIEGPNFFVEKARFIDAANKAKKIDGETYGAAMDVLGALEMAKGGQISKDVPESMLATASSRVKDLFPEYKSGGTV